MDNKLTVKTFEPIKKRFTELCDGNTFEKECSFALQHLAKNSYLASSSNQSLLTSVLNVANIGLTLNPVQKLAYLVPRWNNATKQVECSLEPSYQGLVKLLTDSGSVNNVYSYLIREGDLFEQILGTSNEIIHKPKLGNKGEVIGVYAVAVLTNGSKQVEVMDISSVNEIRDSSESYKAYKAGKAKSCIWVDWYDEMCRKTIIKRLVKYLPKTNYDKIAQAIELTNEDYQATMGQINYIESLLQYASIAEEKKEFIEQMMHTYTNEQAKDCIEMLLSKQINKTFNGLNSNQTDIKEAVKVIGG